MDSKKEELYKKTLLAAKKQILSLQQQIETQALEIKDQSEPIAIVGMSCHFPGGCVSPEIFQNALMDNLDMVIPIPEERKRIKECFRRANNPDHPETSFEEGLEHAAYLREDPFAFDNDFFSITDAEALMTDPQHRILLEQSWLALEDAGIRPSSLAGSNTGVFVGKGGMTYASDYYSQDVKSQKDPYLLTGILGAALSGRISYFYDTRGPSINYDTACSTALTIILSAVDSLRSHGCSLAITGASNLLLSLHDTKWLKAIQAISPDGKSKAFGAAANGFGRGEGSSIVILKRLSDAKRDNDRIHAVILGGVTGSDGKSNGFAAPNAQAQKQLLSRALKEVGISPADVGYIESHGTGTHLGDPVEIEGIIEAYCKNQRAQNILVGSVKSNLGHLENGAGMPSLIKSVFAVRDGQIPASLHATPQNPLLDWQELPLAICDSNMAWPDSYQRKIAGISSFGITGSLTHLLIASPPDADNTNKEEYDLKPTTKILVLSSKKPSGLIQLTNAVVRHLEVACTSPNESEEVLFQNMCHVAGSGRDSLACRLAVVADNAKEAIESLAQFVETGKPSATVFSHEDDPASVRHNNNITFLYTGQGSQQYGMGKELYEKFPICRAIFDRCEAIAKPFMGVSLLEIMFAQKDERLGETWVTQAAIFAHQVALTELWKSRGITPSAVLGHSIGEYSAAYTANIFTLEQGMEIVLQRGALTWAIKNKGAMAALLCSPETLKKLLVKENIHVDIAAINGANSITVAGEEKNITSLLQLLEQEEIRGKLLPVSHAFHSELLAKMLPDFKAILQQNQFNRPSIPYISGFTGQLLKELVDFPTYFCDQTRGTVQFLDAVSAITTDIAIELGASPILTSLCRQITPNKKWLFSQISGVSSDYQLAITTAYLYSKGKEIDFSWLQSPNWKPEALPHTCFQRKSHTPQLRSTVEHANTKRNTRRTQETEKTSEYSEAEFAQKEAYLSNREKELLEKIELIDMQQQLFHELCSKQRQVLAKTMPPPD